MKHARTLGTALLAVFSFAGPTGCDADDRDDEQRSALYCNSSDDPECIELPELAQAVEVVRSMGIDPDAETVEILIAEDEELEKAGFPVDPETRLESRDEADAARAASTLPHGDSLSAEPEPSDPEELSGMNCAWPAAGGGCTCCCSWGWNDEWGCGCTGACGG